MTLIVASAQHDVQFIAADRCISKGGVLVDDEAYKILQYWNSQQGYQFLLAYTGLAEYSRWNTLQWTMESLPVVFDANKDINTAINLFRTKCEQNIKGLVGLPQTNKSLTIILCGRYSKFGLNKNNLEHIPFLTIISNCINEDGSQTGSVSSDFVTFSLRLFRPKSHITICRGDLNAANAYTKEFEDACRLIRRNIPYTAKMKIAVDYIKKVASTNKNNTISESVLGSALLNSGKSVSFDFSMNSDGVQTIPHILSAQGGSVSNFTIIPGSSPRFKSEIEKIPADIPPRYLILTPWMIGEDGKRKPQIDIHYNYERWVDVTSAFSWEKDKECPYYGLIIAYDSDKDTISRIVDDGRYFVLADNQDDLNKPISDAWVVKLSRWFIKYGMTEEKATILKDVLIGKELENAISILKDFLRQPKPGFEDIKRYPPPSGTQHGIVIIDGIEASIHQILNKKKG